MRKLLTLLFVSFLAITTLDAKRLGVEFWGTKGDADATFMQLTTELKDSLGFVVSDPHPKINMGYVQAFGSTTLDNLGFFSIANDEKLRSLLTQYPALGGFSPFNLHIFKKKTEDITWVGHLRPEVMADIVGLTDVKLRKEFLSMFSGLDKKVISDMDSKYVTNIYFDSLPEKPMMEFVYKFDRDEIEDIETFVEEFQETYEETFEDAGYLIAGYKNFKENYDFAGKDFTAFDAYFVYSLCHFPFSNGIFNDVPEAGIFAPCSVYMYIKADSNELHIGMPKLANWVKVANITDAEKIKMINDLDAEIISILEEMGAELQ